MFLQTKVEDKREHYNMGVVSRRPLSMSQSLFFFYLLSLSKYLYKETGLGFLVTNANITTYYMILQKASCFPRKKTGSNDVLNFIPEDMKTNQTSFEISACYT